ncbi:nickel-dependent hydrogenase large subunit [Candidatus Pacearchaeota archaeon]|nr:nickel-dependent hydrogenase large subunit [Candidatus Pacearchaeota archaeon]
MLKRIIDPLNRVEGDMAIEVSIGADNVVKDAKAIGYVYRGFENIFIGKRPFDAMRMSQRSCGVCPVSHGTAGAYAIENAIDFKIPRNAELIRDIVLGANIIVSNATHFYFMWGPDLVDKSYKDYELYPELVKRFDPLKSPHLKRVLTEARIPLHSVVATFGGKFPHPAHAIPGGVTCVPKHIELIKANTFLTEVKAFFEKEILNGITIDEWKNVKSVKDLLELMKNENFANSDIGVFIKVGQDLGLHKLGEGSPKNFLSYGFGFNSDGSMLFKRGLVENGKYKTVDPKMITEDTSKSYYENEKNARNPVDGITKPSVNKKGAYTWIKAPRYNGKVIEAGPLARNIVNKDPLIMDLVKTFGVNTFTRTLARLHECLLILPKLIEWVDEIDLSKPFYHPFPEIAEGVGIGLVEAPRGALGHFVKIKDEKCLSYQIITPTTWNCSPTDSKKEHGAVEQALMGVKLKDKNSSIELAHIVRGFDPCISCSIHAIGNEKKPLFVSRVMN